MSPLAAQGLDANYARPPRNIIKSNVKATTLAPDLYAAILYEGTVRSTFVEVGDLKAFATQVDQQASSGSVLTSLEFGKFNNGSPYYLGVFTEMSGQSEKWWGDEQFFMEKFNTLAPTMGLLDFDVSVVEGGLQWSGCWGGPPVKQQIIQAPNFQSLLSQCSAVPGTILTKIQTWPGLDNNPWVGLLQPGSGGGITANADWNGFYDFYTEQAARGIDLAYFRVFDNSDGIRWYIATWGPNTTKQQFIFDKDWGSLQQQIATLTGTGPGGGMTLSRVTQYHNTIEMPEPNFDASFMNDFGTNFMGYAYCVAQNGVPVAKGVNYSRGGADPKVQWTDKTRMHIASVSKTITGVTMMKVLNVANDPSVLDRDFFPMISRALPNVTGDTTRFKGISVRNLLTMHSGLPHSTANDLYFDNLYDFLTTWLNECTADNIKSDKPEDYNNSNFSLCQAIVNCNIDQSSVVPDDCFADWVSQHILSPMGIDLSIFNTKPEASNADTSTLCYQSAKDTQHGYWFDQIGAVAAGGWVTSVDELIKFMIGVRTNKVLDEPTTQLMLLGGLGWYSWEGLYGQYFSHNGGLFTDVPPVSTTKGLNTIVYRLTDGYDVVLFVNSMQDGAAPDLYTTIINEFEQRSS